MIHDEFDHTSLLRYLSDKWGLRPLTERVARARSIAAAIRSDGRPRDDTPASLTAPAELPAVTTQKMLDAVSGQALNPQQQALVAFGEQLENEIQEPIGKLTRSAALTAGMPSQVAVAKERMSLFLRQQKAKARHL